MSATRSSRPGSSGVVSMSPASRDSSRAVQAAGRFSDRRSLRRASQSSTAMIPTITAMPQKSTSTPVIVFPLRLRRSSRSTRTRVRYPSEPGRSKETVGAGTARRPRCQGQGGPRQVSPEPILCVVRRSIVPSSVAAGDKTLRRPCRLDCLGNSFESRQKTAVSQYRHAAVCVIPSTIPLDTSPV